MQDLESMFLSMESTEEIYQEWENVDGYLTVPYSDDNIVYINNKEVGDMSINVVIVDESFSQYVQFEAPRYEDGVDLTQKRIYVHWEQGDGYAGDNVEAVNVKCTDDVIRFGWVVPAEALTINEEIRIMPFVTGVHNENNYVLKTLYGVLYPQESLKTTTGIIKPNEEWFLSFERKMSSYVEQGADLLSQTRSSEEQTRAIKTFMDDSIFAMAIVNEESGELIQTDDAANMALYEMSVFGKSQQFKTTGAQLWRFGDVATEASQNVFDNEELYLPAGIYTFGCKVSVNDGATSTISFRDSSGTNIKSINLENDEIYNKNKTYIVELTSDCAYIAMYARSKVIYSDIMLNAGDTLLPWEPYTGGKASPNPEYPQEIASVGDDGSVGAKVCGKNLIPSILESGEAGGVKFTLNSDGSITAEGTQVGYAGFQGIATDAIGLRGKTVTLKSPNRGLLQVGLKVITTTGNVVWLEANQDSYTFTMPEDAKTMAYNFYVTKEGEFSHTFYPQLEYGDTSTEYEPFTEQTMVISTPGGLHGVPVSSGGNYTDSDGQQYIADEIRLNADGTGVWVHNVGVIDFNGLVCVRNEFPIDSGIYRFEFRYADNPNIAPSALAYGTTGYCTALSYRFNPLGYNDVDNAIAVYDHGGFYVRCDQFETADDFLAHMQSIDAKVYYILAEPYETELSAEEIEAFLLLRMNKYINNVFNNENAYQRIKYIADPKMYIDNKIAEAIQTITKPV